MVYILSNFFSYPEDGYTFKYYSLDHLVPLIIMLIIILILYKYRMKIQQYKHEKIVRYVIAAVIILTQMSYGWNNAYIGEQMRESLNKVQAPIQASIQKDLPLSLCGIAMVLAGIMLFINSKKLFDVLYFWVFCGSSLALFLPSALKVSNYDYDFGPTRFRYYQFFIGHIGIVLIIMYMIVVLGHKINKQSLIRSFLWLNVFAISTLFINYALGSNYLFLVDPDKTGITFFPKQDILTLITFETVALVFFLLAFLPWYYKEKHIVKNKVSRQHQSIQEVA
ncbi:Integral membrane protein [Haloplasma contractile SSD-17B]|uniref:Integral membrane protein n=1 Tax=Haloplasma contractile SSD-17B TaxID=1033810 RepID=U2ECV8_9MOLU|nr:TIGR02206 family membrane protein [Haloplasma contractile]ERJ12586.1 Integral membrane protein [Haloplasma contractile SSD-17B]